MKGAGRESLVVQAYGVPPPDEQARTWLAGLGGPAASRLRRDNVRGVGDEGRTPSSEVRAAAARGRAAWPMLSLSEERFAAHLAQLLAERPEVRCAELRVADLYLARACVDGDAGALAAFEASFLPAIDGTLQRVRLPREQREDLLQNLRVSLFVSRGAQPGRIAQYHGTGDLRRWLRAIALRDAWRTGKSVHRELALDDAVLATVGILDEDPALAGFKEACRAELKHAFVAALETLGPEDRTVLRQYHLDGLTIDELARLYGIHRATAARRVGKARSLLTESVVAGLGERLQIRDRELASVLELVRSQLDLSLDRLLGAAAVGSDEQGDNDSERRAT